MTCWRSITGFQGYEVSDAGVVRSLDRLDGRGWQIRGRILAGSLSPSGYLRVQLHREGVPHYQFVHRLVLEAFVGPCPQGMQTRHLNGDPQDNRVSNLAWGTAAENAADKWLHGTATRPPAARCHLGHDLTDPENLTVVGKCRTCQRRRSREYMARYRQAHPTGKVPNGEKTHCSHGHAFTPENTIERRRPDGGVARQCRTCKRNQNVEFKRRKRAARREDA